MCCAVLLSDVVVGHAGVHPVHLCGKRWRHIHEGIGHYRTIKDPFVATGGV